MKKRKFTVAIVLAVLIPVIGIFAIGAYGVSSYLNKVPTLTPKENVTIKTDSSISIEGLCDIEKDAEKRIISAVWADGTSEGAEISEDGQSLRTGDKTGTLTVSIGATGENHESRSAEVIVTVTD